MKAIIKSAIAANAFFSAIHSTAGDHGGKLPMLEPHDVGDGHSFIIHKLQDRMAETPPTNNLEYLHAMSLEMRAHLCDETDPICNARIVHRTLRSQPGPKNGHTDGFEYMQSILPEDFDAEVMGYMDKLFGK